MVLRLYRRVQGRVDASDVIQEGLVLGHYDQLTNGDAAAAVGLEKSAARKRYTRALQRFRESLAALPGKISGEGT